MHRVLIFLGVSWIGANLVGAWVSIDHEQPYDLTFVDTAGDASRIVDDWVYGWGTGLAMPLWFLAVVAGLTLLVSVGGTPTRFAGLLLTLGGVASVFYSLSSRLTVDRLQATGVDATETAVIRAVLLLDGLLILVGALTYITTPRTPPR